MLLWDINIFFYCYKIEGRRPEVRRGGEGDSKQNGLAIAGKERRNVIMGH
jgi:hypothetical protein